MAWLLACSACENAENKRCSTEYEAAQRRVLEVEAKSLQSVDDSLKAVQAAMDACRVVNRNGEVDQLVRAKNELVAQRGVLERRARRRVRKEPTTEELARLVREGDPSCPRGQAYRHGDSKEIRCTGKQLIEMSLVEAKAHFEEREYRVRTPAPTTLEAEHGAERFTLAYSSPTAKQPSCVVLVPAPGIPWKEALSRASGAKPSRLENPGTLRVGDTTLPFVVDEARVIVRIGDCPSG